MILPVADARARALRRVHARSSRSAMLETLGEDYVLTARAKGLHDLDDRAPARAAQRAAADRHADRALARLHRRRGDPRRGRLLLAGHRAARCTTRSTSATTRCCRARSWSSRSRSCSSTSRRPPLLQARPEDHRMSVVHPSEPRPRSPRPRAGARVAASCGARSAGRAVGRDRGSSILVALRR